MKLKDNLSNKFVNSLSEIINHNLDVIMPLLVVAVNVSIKKEIINKGLAEQKRQIKEIVNELNDLKSEIVDDLLDKSELGLYRIEFLTDDLGKITGVNTFYLNKELILTINKLFKKAKRITKKSNQVVYKKLDFIYKKHKIIIESFN